MLLAFAVVLCLRILGVLQPAAAHLAALQTSAARAGTARTEKPLTACGALRRGNTRYVLQGDIEAAGTCISIEADNITLDLNGHRITYATSDGTKPTFGVIAADCWYQPIAGNPCGGSHRGIEILHGRIVQGAAAAAMSHALRFGQGNNLSGVIVHDLDITVHAEDSIPIYGEYLPGGSNIFANTIHNNVTVISSRTQFRGASIKLDEEDAAKLPDQIHHNVIVGGAQLGIRSDNKAGTRIFENDISQDATYTNGFCIDAAGAGMQISKNRCHPVHGRGIHSNQSGVQILDNVVETIDSDRNQEYNGCEINGTYGIQVESDNFAPSGIRVSGNHVKVHAGACHAEAMRLTDLKNARVEITNNEFVAVVDPGAPRPGKDGEKAAPPGARGFSVGNVDGREITFSGNTVRADTSIFHMDWDGGGGFLLTKNRFQAGQSGTLLAEFGNGVGASQGNSFRDNSYDGVSPTAARFGDYSQDSRFSVTRTFVFHVSDSGGRAVRGAQVKAVFESGESAASLTDASGNAQLVLPIARLEHNKPPRSYTQHRISVTSSGCRALQSMVDVKGPPNLSETLHCP